MSNANRDGGLVASGLFFGASLGAVSRTAAVLCAVYAVIVFVVCAARDAMNRGRNDA
jgi:hypothetical protein